MNEHPAYDWGDLCERFAIDAGAIAQRRAHVGLTHADDAALASVRDELGAIAVDTVDAFYGHLLAQPDLRTALGEGALVSRLKETMTDYVRSLGQDAAAPGYFEARLRIGIVHEANGLPVRHMTEAFAILFEMLAVHFGGAVLPAGQDPSALVRSIAKFMWLDAALGSEAYQDAAAARMQAVVERLRDTEAQLREASSTDELTGVLNRRELMHRLEIEFDRARRYNEPLVLLFADLDKFKNVNDTHGHEAGDAVLRHVATRLHNETRPADIVGRYGGEEFVIGLVQSGADRGVKVAERLRAAVEDAPVSYDGAEIPMTISIGVVPLMPATDDLGALIADADAALYRAKESGRNRVFLGGTAPADETGAAEAAS